MASNSELSQAQQQGYTQAAGQLSGPEYQNYSNYGSLYENNPVLSQVLQGAKAGTITSEQAYAYLNGGSVPEVDNYLQHSNNPLIQSLLQYHGPTPQGTPNTPAGLLQYWGTQNPSQAAGAAANILSDPTTGMQYATDEFMKNPTVQGLFGANGLQGQAEKAYTTGEQGFNDAMSQAKSGQIDPLHASMLSDEMASLGKSFGTMGNLVSGTASQYGLGGGINGFTGAGLQSMAAGAYGNIGLAMDQMANDSFNNSLSLANQYGNNAGANATYAQNLGAMGTNGINTQYNNNVAGTDDTYNKLAGTAGLATDINTAAVNSGNQQMSAWTNSQPPSLGSILGATLPAVAGAATTAATKTPAAD